MKALAQRVSQAVARLWHAAWQRVTSVVKPLAARLRLTGLAGWQRVALVVGLAILLVGVGAMAATARVSGTNDRILHGVRVDGVDLGGMNREQAIRALSAHADQVLHRTIMVCGTVNGHRRHWTVTPAALGQSAGVSRAVETALAGPRLSWVANTWHRVSGQSVNLRVPLPYHADNARVVAYVHNIARQLDVAPVNAGIVLVGGSIAMHHAHTGWVVDEAAGVRSLTAAVSGSQGTQTVQLRVVRALPKVADRQLGRTVGVDLSSNRLTLWNGFKVLRTYSVATAKPGFTTPRGSWKVVSKVMFPTWHNPAPNGWGSGEPLVIPPGPGNPLGTRALNLSAPAIRIHGTPSDYSIGHYASHGCIRMHMPDVEALYPLVPVGTPVLIHGTRG